MSLQETRFVPMTEQDRASYVQRHEAALARMGELVRKKEEFNTANKEAMKRANGEVSTLELRLAQGDHEVVCDIELDYVEGIARYHRADTGQRVYHRPLSDGERQRQLDFNKCASASDTKISEAAKQKQPGLNDLPDDQPPPLDPALVESARLHGLVDASVALLAMFGEEIALRVVERMKAGGPPSRAMAWGTDRHQLVEALPSLAHELGWEKTNKTVELADEFDLPAEAAIGLARGTIDLDAARALPKPWEAVTEEVDADGAPAVVLSDLEKQELRDELDTEDEKLVDWVFAAIENGHPRGFAGAVADAAKAAADFDDDQLWDKHDFLLEDLVNELEVVAGPTLAALVHNELQAKTNDVLATVDRALVVAKRIKALPDALRQELTPAEPLEDEGEEWISELAESLFDGESFDEALAQVRVNKRRVDDANAAAAERERLAAEPSAASSAAAFDAAMPPAKPRKPRAKKSKKADKSVAEGGVA